MQKSQMPFSRCLFACFAFIAAMLAARMIYSGGIHFLFLVWNLFLAWVPYAVSILFRSKSAAKKSGRLLLFGTWLLFFPNALYIITDIIHLRDTGQAPVWYDAVLLFTASFTGLAMGFASLVNVELFIGRVFPRLSKRYNPLIIILFFFLGAFGVYLGRFERWNSWNIINDPNALLQNIAIKFTAPVEHVRTWGVTALLTALYTISWFSLKSFRGLEMQEG